MMERESKGKRTFVFVMMCVLLLVWIAGTGQEASRQNDVAVTVVNIN